MYCERCGGTMNVDARFCSHCGAQNAPPVEPPVANHDAESMFDAAPAWEAPTLDADLVGENRPWLRYWARLTDLLLLEVFAGGLLGAIAPHALEDKVFENLFGFVCMAAWVLIEPLHLVANGTTPGKWLFRTRIQAADGRRPTYEDALMRSFRVWWRGLGAGVPIVSLVTLIMAHGKLSRQGVTSWDRDGGFTVVHRRLGPGRIFAIACVAAALVTLMIVGMSLND